MRMRTRIQFQQPDQREHKSQLGKPFVNRNDVHIAISNGVGVHFGVAGDNRGRFGPVFAGISAIAKQTVNFSRIAGQNP